MMINCKKAAQLIDQKDAAEDIGWWGKKKLKFHVVLCKMCKGYEKDSHTMSKLIRYTSAEHSDNCLSKVEKENIKKQLKR